VRIAVQTVLFETPPAHVARLIRAVGAAAAQLPAAAVSFLVGDCTPEPIFADREEDLAVEGAALSDVRYLPFSENLGHGAAQNALTDLHACEHVVLLNPDSYLAPHALKHLTAALADVTVGAAEGRQLPMESPRLVSYATGDTPWGAGCLLALRREAFDRVGRFDPAYFLHDDDVDLCWRLRRAGYGVRYVPQAMVFHHRSVDPSGYAESTPVEALMMSLGEMLLMHRAGSGDLAADAFRARARTDAPPHERRAAELYQDQLYRGTVPTAMTSAVSPGLLLDRRLRRF
jgi:hypothetical protein